MSPRVVHLLRRLAISVTFWRSVTLLISVVLAAGVLSLLAGCGPSRMVITLRDVPLSDCQAEVVRAEKAIRDFGFAVDSVDFGCRNGTFIDVTVTGRAKRWVEKYNDEHHRRLELEAARDKEGK